MIRYPSNVSSYLSFVTFEILNFKKSVNLYYHAIISCTIYLNIKELNRRILNHYFILYIYIYIFIYFLQAYNYSREGDLVYIKQTYILIRPYFILNASAIFIL